MKAGFVPRIVCLCALAMLLFAGSSGCTKDTPDSATQLGVRWVRALAADDSAAMAELYGFSEKQVPDLSGIRSQIFGPGKPIAIRGIRRQSIQVVGKRRGAPVYQVELRVGSTAGGKARAAWAVVMVSGGRVIGAMSPN